MLKWFISVVAVLVILPSSVVHARVSNNEVMRCPKFELFLILLGVNLDAA
jgi:hypothetical protein